MISQEALEELEHYCALAEEANGEPPLILVVGRPVIDAIVQADAALVEDVKQNPAWRVLVQLVEGR